MKLYIDTGAFYARMNLEDAHHREAVRGFSVAKDGHQVFTSNFVVHELIHMVQHRRGGKVAIQVAEAIYGMERLEIVRLTARDELDALALFQKMAFRKVSFTDCTSFVLMSRLGIKHVFGFDNHFASAGFTLWPDKT